MSKTTIGTIYIDYEKEEVVNSSGKSIEFRPQTFAVFSYLCKNRGRVVTKNELLENVWEGVVVTDDSIVKCISEIRKELDIESSIDVKTVTRRGYLLTESQIVDNTSSPKVAEIPTIAVLPFTSLSDECALFANGLTEDITTHLSSQKDIFVIARHSTNAYKNNADVSSIREICDDLNVRYILQGSIQSSNEFLRINVQLSDAQSNTQIWSERYIESNTDIFEVQDNISAKIVNRISGSAGVVISAERSQLHRNLPASPEAYELYVLGSNVDKSLSKDGAAETIAIYEKAVSIDPQFARAWVRLACLHLISAACAYTDNLEETLGSYVECSLRAAELDPNDSLGQATAGGAYCILDELGKGKECFDRALLLGPNDADTLAFISYVRPTKYPTVDKDLENVRRAIGLNPYYPMWYSLAHGYCAYHAGFYEEAIEAYGHADTNIPDTHLYLTLCYAEIDDPEMSVRHKTHLLDLNPNITATQIIEGDAMRNQDVINHFLKSAGKAGLPI